MNKPRRAVAMLVAGVFVGLTGFATAASAATTMVIDAFSRSVGSGWGAAEAGGSWSVGGQTSTMSVANGSGRMVLGPGAESSAGLPAAQWSDAEVRVEFGADKVPTGGGHYYSVGRVNATGEYRAATRARSDGSVVLSLRRSANQAETVLVSKAITGLNVQAGTRLALRMSITGSNPTNLSAKIWKVGQAEPSSWQVTFRDPSATVAGTGSLKLTGYVSSSATNGPVAVAFDNLGVTTQAPAPVVTGTRPDASTTGVPSGVALKRLSRSNIPYAADTIYSDGSVLIINTPNAVYDGYQFDQFVEVRAPGVKLTRSLFRGFSSGGRPLLNVPSNPYPAGQPSALVEDSSLIPQSPNGNINGVMGSNFTLRRVEITGTVDGVHVHGTTVRTDPNAGNVTIEASWIHDLPHYMDSSHSDGSHNDGVQVIGGKNIRIVGSRFDGTMHNAAVMVSAGRNDVSNVTVSGNWLAGGGCTVNVYDGNVATAIQGIKLTSNVFTRGTTRNVDCAMTVSNRTKAITTASGNTWHDNSTPLPTVRGG